MKNTLLKVLWIISGILLIIAGVFCFVSPGAALVTISVYVGIALLITGIIDIFIYFKGKDVLLGAGWVLFEGITGVILALLLLFNSEVMALVLPYVFGFWVLWGGTSRVISSLDMRALGVPGWGWITAYGILGILVGFLSFFRPITAAIAIGALLGFFLVYQGIVTISGALMSKRFFRD
ncbi:DUF308 domain-containing protein [Eubacteriales bacterium OttesenSCG-928-M02]|nr:DUF308 domain-containing protein [Eubacteriales bacterium OttesenSCG-928-M02]